MSDAGRALQVRRRVEGRWEEAKNAIYELSQANYDNLLEEYDLKVSPIAGVVTARTTTTATWLVHHLYASSSRYVP